MEMNLKTMLNKMYMMDSNFRIVEYANMKNCDCGVKLGGARTKLRPACTDPLETQFRFGFSGLISVSRKGQAQA